MTVEKELVSARVCTEAFALADGSPTIGFEEVDASASASADAVARVDASVVWYISWRVRGCPAEYRADDNVFASLSKSYTGPPRPLLQCDRFTRIKAVRQLPLLLRALERALQADIDNLEQDSEQAPDGGGVRAR